MSTATAIRQEAIFSVISPLDDPRWDTFLARHPLASVFHTSAWLKALHRTYGYQPLLLTDAAAGAELRSAIVFCRVDSWLTGRRFVSVPFADHCAPLLKDPNQLGQFVAGSRAVLAEAAPKYLEFRPAISLPELPAGLSASQFYCHQQLDLTPDLATLFGNFHKDSVQRKIRRAERDGVRYAEGNSEDLLRTFYSLLVMTRQRHGLPPQPMKWFSSLAECFGGDLKIRVATVADQPIAAILTLRYKDTLVYKYGASDTRHNAAGGTHLLLWRSIQEAKQAALRTFDLGRSDWENSGLITFKKRWGATGSELTYFRMPFGPGAGAHGPLSLQRAWGSSAVKQIMQRLPRPVLRWAGEKIYRHIA